MSNVNTRAYLERVAEHLYRHKGNGAYYGIVVVNKKKRIKVLRISEGLPSRPSAPTRTASCALGIKNSLDSVPSYGLSCTRHWPECPARR
jgi:hypothetical protein